MGIRICPDCGGKVSTSRNECIHCGYVFEQTSNIVDFEIENGVLIAYRGVDNDVVIPNGVTEIGEDAFFDCKSITSVFIPDSVISIGSNAFEACENLKSVTFSKNSILKTIGFCAFARCIELSSIEIPNSVTTIEKHAFDLCGITSIVIPNSIVSIGSDCPFSYADIYGGKAFEFCNIIEASMPVNAIWSIENKCLETIKITSGSTIDRGTFFDCRKLKCIDLCDGITTIGELAFYDCTSLTSIVIPDSVTTIGSYAFGDCKKLTDVYYTGTKEQWKAISIDSGNSSLTNATIHYNYVADEN